MALPTSASTSSSYSSSPSAAAATTSTLASHRTLTITLSTVLSVVGVLLLVGAGFAFRRYRRRGSLFPRGISPIDDDEIETWKVGQVPEKLTDAGGVISEASGGEGDGPTWPPATARHWGDASTRARAMTVADPHDRQADTQPAQRTRGISLDSAAVVTPPLRRSPSKVIIDEEPPMPRNYFSTSYGLPSSAVSAAFQHALNASEATDAGISAASPWKQHKHRHSEDLASPRTGRSARSLSLGQNARLPIVGRFSLDQDREQNFALSQLSPQSQSMATQMPAAVHARAPNSRTGLTDETIPGDPSFLPSPRPLRRQTSRLVKQPHMAVVGEGKGEAAEFSTPLRGSHGHRSSQSGASSNNGGGGHSFWHIRTRSGRSSSTVSGRSLGSEVGLQQQSQQQQQQQREEEVPPLPSASLPATQPHRQRSASDLAHESTATVAERLSSESHVYRHHQHARFYPSSTPPRLSLDEDANGDDQGPPPGGLSPRPQVLEQSSIGRAIG